MTRLDADDKAVEVVAVVVTYHSALTLPALLESLADQTVGVHTIVVDNGSSDGTAALARTFSGVTVVETGANLGYSGGINVGRAQVHGDPHLAILNPDLVLRPGALATMLRVLSDDPRVGIVAPQLVESATSTRFDSLRREPSVLGAFGDSVFGNRWPSRPRLIAETLRREDEYAEARDVAWAGGAALLVSATCNSSVGAWDEHTYFLYSEETDFARRARDLGFLVRYEPAAVAEHVGSGSGQPKELVALVSVNRIRYFSQRHGAGATTLFRAAVAVQHLLRLHDARHRYAFPVVLNRSRWNGLPSAERRTPTDSRPSGPSSVTGPRRDR